MKIVRNTLSLLVQRWEDGGDYPSNAGQGPLPSRVVGVGCEGELVVELTCDEFSAVWRGGFEEFVSAETEGIRLPDGILSVEWAVDRIWPMYRKSRCEGYRVTLFCPEAENNPDYRGPEPPDEKEY
jgi:hypothetical protein